MINANEQNRVFLFLTGIFRVHNQGKSQNYTKYFQVLALEVFTWHERPLDMDEPCLAGKIIAINSRVTLSNHLLFRRFPIFNSHILMGGEFC